MADRDNAAGQAPAAADNRHDDHGLSLRFTRFIHVDHVVIVIGLAHRRYTVTDVA